MPYSRWLFIVVASIVAPPVPVASYADETGTFLDYASLQPESRDVGRRPMSHAQIVTHARSRRDEQPLVDFAFAFSRAVAAPDPSNHSGGLFRRKPYNISASMQHQDLVIAELEARESQIASDLEAKAAVEGATPAKGRIVVPASAPVPLIFEWPVQGVTPTTVAPQKGWSGMTLAAQGVALRFVDEGGRAPVQYR